MLFQKMREMEAKDRVAYFDTFVFKKHEFLLHSANVVRHELVNGNENEHKEDADQERDSDLGVEQVERDSDLDWQTPEHVEARESVHDGVCVCGHVVDNLADRVLAQLAQLDCDSLAVDQADKGASDGQAKFVH